MISLDRLKQVREVYMHASCPDGSASAIIISAAFRGMESPEFYPLQYDTEFMDKLEPKEGQLFVDITPPKKRWEEWRDVNPIVLDHHETVKHVVEGLNGVYQTNDAHSGAMLAYENVLVPFAEAGYSGFDHSEMNYWHNFANLAMVRDTWKKDHPDWRKASAQGLALQFNGSKPLIAKARTERFDFDGVQGLGDMLQANSDRRTELTASGATHEVIQHNGKTFKVASFNSTEKIISDAANYLIEQGVDIALGYFYLYEDGQQKMVVSIRTNGSVSAREIAQTFGGGGHTKAAGFRIANANLVPPHVLFSYIEQGIRASSQ